MLEAAIQKAVVEATLDRYPSARDKALSVLALTNEGDESFDPGNSSLRLAGADDLGDMPLERVRACLMSAAAEFAELDCKAPRHENWMSGSFESRLVSSFLHDEGTPNVWAADLLGRRETETGADFALFLEVDDRFVALLLQAKRTLHPITDGPARTVCIKRDPRPGEEDELWQYERLLNAQEKHRFGLAAAYLFYDNSKIANREPGLPLAKHVRNITNGELLNKSVDLTVAAADIATFGLNELLRRSADSGDVGLLDGIVDTILEKEARRILVISARDEFPNSLEAIFYRRHGSRVVKFSNLTLRPASINPTPGPGRI